MGSFTMAATVDCWRCKGAGGWENPQFGAVTAKLRPFGALLRGIKK